MAFIYTYVDLENVLQEVDGATLDFVGAWSSLEHYGPGNVVLYNASRYIALTASIGSQPPTTLIRDDQWSVLTLVSSGTSSSSNLAEIAYDLATYAISIAGTAAGGTTNLSVPMALGKAALETAWEGTNAAVAAYAVAKTALETSWLGTAANTPFDVNTILTTIDGNVVVNSSGNVVVSGGF